MRDPRRFHLADVMILVVAAAASSLIVRGYLPGFWSQLGYVRTLPGDPLGFWRVYLCLHGLGSCVVIPAMVATIAMRWRRPRPRLFRFQPGYVACLAVMVSMVPGMAWVATIHHRPGFQRPEGFEQVWTIATEWTDTAVVGAWLALMLAGTWRAERSWIDRAGRVLGWFWILLLASVLAYDAVQALQNLFSGDAT